MPDATNKVATLLLPANSQRSNSRIKLYGPESEDCTEQLYGKEAVCRLLNSRAVWVTQQMQYFILRQQNKNCRIKLNSQSVRLHTIHANAIRQRGLMCNAIYVTTCIVRGGKRDDACVRHIGRTASVVAEVAESDQCLLATPPAPNRAGVPPNPRNDALHPSRRRVASLSPLWYPSFPLQNQDGMGGGA